MADPAPATGRHLRLVWSPGQHNETRATRAPVEAPPIDRLHGLLDLPAGQPLPEIPELDRIEPELPRQPELAAVMRDALANLRIDWD